MSFLYDFFSLIYPNVCFACGKPLLRYEKCICSICLHHLPQTDFHLSSDNPVAQLFWGKVNVESASSFLFFNKGGKVQHLIHQLKYKNQKQVGTYLGTLYGNTLKKSRFFGSIDTVIPVPLHPKKQRQRGYNQSEYFAMGLAESLSIVVDNTTLYRTYASESQTKKSRYSRYQNVSSIFALKDTNTLSGKHILLVDDVITTGSTIESCVNTLQQIHEIKISVASIAIAN